MFILHKNRLNFQYFFVLLIFFELNNSEPLRSKEYNLTHFISGGIPDDKYNLGKFVVSIQLKSYLESKLGWYHFCGGSIISSKKILTAAHCLYRRPGKIYTPNEIVVVVGLRNRFTHTDDTQIKNVAFVKVHKAFRRVKTLFADVGILILKEEIQFNNPHVAIIGLTNTMPMLNEFCTVVGWGKLFDKGPTSDTIAFADVEILSRRDCKRKYHSSFTPGMICAGYTKSWERDACTGDSGGPLICDKTIVGIVSWGIGCGRSNLPGVYTDVYYFKEWISKAFRLRANYFFVILCLNLYRIFR